MALKVESVVDRGVHVQETLGGFGRFEALQLALSSSYHLMRILCPIVLSQPLFVTAGQRNWRNAEAYERSLSVTSRFGVEPCFFRSLRISRSAARLSRRR